MHRLTQRTALLITLGILLTGSFLGISLFNYSTARSSLENEIIHSTLPLLRENIYSEIQNDLLPAINVSSVMASDTFLMTWAEKGEKDPGEVVKYLDRIRREYGYHSAFFVSHRTRVYYRHSGIAKTISSQDSHDVWYFNFISSGLTHQLDVDNDEHESRKLTIFINFRVLDSQGELLGVTGVGLEMDSISQGLRDKQKQFSRTIFMTDEAGIIQAHSDETFIQARSILHEDGIRTIAPRLLVKTSEPLNLQYTGSGGLVLVSSRYMPEMDWFLIVEQPEDAALASARWTLFFTLGIGLLVSVVILLLAALNIEHFARKLEAAAETDELTGVANRRRFNQELTLLCARFSRNSRPHTLILFDIDRFKSINDSEGHQKGDDILKTISSLIHGAVRPGDFFSRWGGDEFALVIEGGLEEGRRLITRLQQVLKDYPEWTREPPTLSFGLAVLQEGDTPDDLVRRADRALYRAKEEGRNRAAW